MVWTNVVFGGSLMCARLLKALSNDFMNNEENIE